MKINEAIKQARLAAGLSDLELARRLGKTITEYMDIEYYDDELASVEDLHVVRELCQILHIDPFNLLGIDKDNIW
jgi:transcriptional regulator with XRE-family HTH domain